MTNICPQDVLDKINALIETLPDDDVQRKDYWAQHHNRLFWMMNRRVCSSWFPNENDGRCLRCGLDHGVAKQ